MYKDVLSDIEGISIYPIISLIVFVSFFVVLGIYVFKMKKDYISEMKKIPLEENGNKVVLDKNETTNVQ